MGKNNGQQIFQYLKNSTLDDFKEHQYKNKTNLEPARVAAGLVELETIPSKQLIDR